jgi:hypothetical protein
MPINAMGAPDCHQMSSASSRLTKAIEEDQSEDAESEQRSRGSERSAMVPANIRDSVVRKRRIAFLRVRRALPDAIIRAGPVVNGEPRQSRVDDLRYLGGGHV